jgi:MFS-type transporter involved in bile tolerance (Atg22 family)
MKKEVFLKKTYQEKAKMLKHNKTSRQIIIFLYSYLFFIFKIIKNKKSQ